MESPPGLLPFYGRSLGGDICVMWLQPALRRGARKVTSATLFVSVNRFVRTLLLNSDYNSSKGSIGLYIFKASDRTDGTATEPTDSRADVALLAI